jgi:SAM-dependent methyltransferase
MKRNDRYRWTLQICPTCESPPTKYMGKRGGASHRDKLGVETEIWSCGTCGLIFPNPMPFPVGGLAQHYEVDADEYFQAHDKTVKLKGAKGLVEQTERLLGRKGRLLDVGVGRGEVVSQAKANGWQAEGIEPSESFADYAEKEIGVKIWRSGIEDAEIEASSFDVVILSAVLEHLYDPDAVIKKVRTILKPGGLLFLDVPNERGLYFRIGNAYQKLRGRKWCVNLAPTFPPFHVFGFSPTALRALLGKHGLSPVVWKVYPGTSMVPQSRSLIGRLESLASMLVTTASNIGEMGTYIETWARKDTELNTSEMK